MGDRSVSLGVVGELRFLPEPGPDSKRDSQELNRVFRFSGSSGLPSPLWEEMHFRLVDRRRPADAPAKSSVSRRDFAPDLGKRWPSSLPALALLSVDAPVVW